MKSYFESMAGAVPTAIGPGVGAPPIEAGAFHPSAGTRVLEYGLPALMAILLWLVDLRRRDRVRDVA